MTFVQTMIFVGGVHVLLTIYLLVSFLRQQRIVKVLAQQLESTKQELVRKTMETLP